MTWPAYGTTNYRRKSTLGTLQQRIWRALKDAPLSCTEIAATIGVEPQPVRASLYVMRTKLGIVQMVGGGPTCRYLRVKGARAPRDKRGTVAASLRNLEPSTRERLLVIKMRSLGKVWHPPRRAGCALEEVWPV